MKKQTLLAVQMIVASLFMVALSLEFDYWRFSQQLPGPFEHDGGNLWISGKIRLPLPGIFESHDDISGMASSLKLFEGGRESGPAHALRDDIRNLGAGRYSHWGRRVLFSTSDGRDPNDHPRDFFVTYPIHAKLTCLVVLFLIMSLLALASFRKETFARFDPDALRELLADHRLFILLAGIIGLGALFRIFWTWTLKAPYLEPDSADYLQQAVSNPVLPISEVRTAGAPYLIASGLLLFQHPVGVLIVNNLLWLFSTVLIVGVLVRHHFLRICALLTAAYMSFAQKNIAFEYFLLSEHAARVLYVVFFAIIIGCVRDAWRARVALALAAVVIFNILVKPSALVLIPVSLLYFLVTAMRLFPGRKRQAFTAAMTFLSITAGCLLGYGYLFHKRYGPYDFTNFTGWNLYSHVGQFTVLDGGIYPDLKQELKKVLPRYNETYASRGNDQPDWLVYGASNQRLKADFGGESPASIIQRYVERNKQEGSRSNIARMNEIYLALSLEAIREHPGRYLWYALTETMSLITRNGGLFYSDIPAPGLYTNHGTEMNQWRGFMHRYLPENQPQEYFTVLKTALDGVPGSYFDNQGWRYTLYRFLYFTVIFINCVLAIMIIGAMIIGIKNLFSWPGIAWRHYSPEARIFILLGMATVISYALFLGLVNTSAPSRFATNVQDIFVITLFMLATGGPAMPRASRRTV